MSKTIVNLFLSRKTRICVAPAGTLSVPHLGVGARLRHQGQFRVSKSLPLISVEAVGIRTIRSFTLTLYMCMDVLDTLCYQ
jgi:hypothetical protein